MKAKVILIVLALAAMLALSIGLSAAQGPNPVFPTGASGGEPQAAVGSAFTYQGELKKNGSPVDATCNMVFRLYDADTAGNLHGAITTTVTVESGLFTVALDFGSYAFQGSARWLEVAVQCPGDTGFNTLTPRQALTATPYALSLRPGAEIIEAVGSSWILLARNTATSTVSGGLLGMSDSTLGYGVRGLATAGSGETSGVYGESDSSQGYGVYGVSDHIGVYGETSAAGGDGVFGYSKATSSETYGVYGRTDSTQGMGVFGRAAATTGTTSGVYGRSDSTTAGRGVYGTAPVYGVYGYATATDRDTHGVYGRSDSGPTILLHHSSGVYGYASATSGHAYGVYGKSDSSQGAGVYGYATATSGYACGVLGASDSTDGRGVYGSVVTTSGETYGVYGHVYSPQGVGVYGHNSASSGAGVYGEGPNAVIGMSSTPGYAAIFGRNQATTGNGTGLYGRSDSPDGWSGYFYNTVGNGVYISAPATKVGLTVVSGTKNAAVRTDSGSRLLYTEESAEVWFTDYGFGRLKDGSATVVIDPLFAQTVNLKEPYHVFIQVYGGAQVYVSQRTPSSFEVRLWAGDPNVEFSYRIVAKRLGYEDARLAPAPWADSDPNLYPDRAPAEP